eukprot:CAMPEP_0204612096 /NCGR_PEP_ID=MMETSP0717-20131115/197_1 /ASSEMBLY_ACC=CAM_ASM_000666 /TAXON_ID=230516 /ORGANISM="Chaetoceros curvisetus" /LENGTH=64 /DNA_ID=CAMNT_0051624035 /DNA_START=354 /DNA_END=545 /DNA_ORIENTATION=+
MTIVESTTFNGFNILIHDDSFRLPAIIKCTPLYDFDGGVDDHFGSIGWSIFILEFHVHVNGGGE